MAITVVFGVYAVAVLVSLLVFGALSDHIGRRPVLTVALVAQAGVMLLFATASGLDVLLLARVLQGLATGAAVAAIGAALVDLHPGRGPVANAAGAMSGTASGALISALLVQLLPAPTQLVYLVMLALFLLQAAGVRAIAETSPPRPGRAALAASDAGPPGPGPRRPRRRRSVAGRRVGAGRLLRLARPVARRPLDGSRSTILGGAALFVLAGTGALTVLAFHRTEARTFALAGAGLIIIGVALLLAAVPARSPILFFTGTAIAGAGFGGGFQGGLRTIVTLARRGRARRRDRRRLRDLLPRDGTAGDRRRLPRGPHDGHPHRPAVRPRRDRPGGEYRRWHPSERSSRPRPGDERDSLRLPRDPISPTDPIGESP